MSFSCMQKHNYVVVGEAGSGKTEIALNLAIKLAKSTKRKVCFFDMDQTKGLFRSRDFKDALEQNGVVFFDTITFMDSPIVPVGVTGALADENCVCIFDVGGNAVGARMIGQYSQYFSEATTDVFYVINTYRPFSESSQQILKTMERIIHVASLENSSLKIISNPSLGYETTSQHVLDGHKKLNDNLKVGGYRAFALTVVKNLFNEVQPHVDYPVIPISLFINY